MISSIFFPSLIKASTCSSVATAAARLFGSGSKTIFFKRSSSILSAYFRLQEGVTVPGEGPDHALDELGRTFDPEKGPIAAWLKEPLDSIALQLSFPLLGGSLEHFQVSFLGPQMGAYGLAGFWTLDPFGIICLFFSESHMGPK